MRAMPSQFLRAVPIALLLLLAAACPGPGPSSPAVTSPSSGCDAGSHADAGINGPAGCARVFLTSAAYGGNLGSAGGDALQKADQLCAAAAAQGHLSGVVFKAYLSDATTDAWDRLTYQGPYCATAPNGQVGALLYNDRIAWKANPLVQLATDERGQPLTESRVSYAFDCGLSSYSGDVSTNAFWFGSSSTGAKVSENCSGWSTDDANFCVGASRGTWGLFDVTPQLATYHVACLQKLRLLCFEVK